VERFTVSNLVKCICIKLFYFTFKVLLPSFTSSLKLKYILLLEIHFTFVTLTAKSITKLAGMTPARRVWEKERARRVGVSRGRRGGTDVSRSRNERNMSVHLTHFPSPASM